MTETHIPEHDDVQLKDVEGDCRNCGPTTMSLMKKTPAILFMDTDNPDFMIDIKMCQSCGAIYPVEQNEEDVNKYSDVYMSFLQEHELVDERELQEMGY